MELERVKNFIKSEFGTHKRFCDLSGRTPYDLQLFFLNCQKNLTQEREQELYVIYQEAEKLSDSEPISQSITPELREKMLKAMSDFGYKYNKVSEMLKRRKNRTEVMDEFIKKLGVC
jgi:hypothetical protein